MKTQSICLLRSFLAACVMGLPTLSAETLYTKEMVAGVVLLDWPELTKEQCFRYIDGIGKRSPGSEYTVKDVERIRLAIETKVVIAGMPDHKPEPPKKKPLWGIKIREDYNDVTGEEDPTADTEKERRDQLAGAAFAYTRDYDGNNDNWSAKMALIRPFEIFKDDPSPTASDAPLKLRHAFLVPSVSLHKVKNESNAVAEDEDVDSLIYRLGGTARFTGVSQGNIQEVELRGYATYGTDTSHDSSIAAGEFDLEPRIAGRGSLAKLALGFPASLCGRPEGSSDGDGDSNLTYHLRAFLHGEFGEVNDPGEDSDLVEGDFFRMGPVMKLEVQPSWLARKLRRKHDGIKLYTSYSWLPRVSGQDNGHDYLLNAGIDVALIDEDEKTVSLKLLYEKGALDLTKEEIDTLTLGLGITF